MLTSFELGALLAAVGNHEAKALTFLSMDPDERYGVSALHRRFLEIQGPRPVFVGTVNLQQKYCIHSFESAGLVRRELSEKGNIQHVQRDDAGIATALAGHLLASTERHPVTLSQILGKTAVRGTVNSDAERSPIRRLTLLRALVQRPLPVHQADLARRTGLPDMSISMSAVALAKVGLLGYETRPTYTMKSRYHVPQPLPALTGSGNYALHNAVVDYINNHRMVNTVVITRDEIEAHLRTQPRWAGVKGLRDILQRVMIRLSEHGHIVPVQDFAGQSSHTVLSLTSRQRRFIEEILAGVDAIAARDEHAITHGQDQASRIIDDPTRVRKLITKAYKASKLAANPISAQEKQRRILAVLQSHNGATTEEITTRLSPDLNPALIRRTLSELTKMDHIRGEQQDGPYKRWFLT